VEFQDLVSYGMFGLIDAIERYDLSAGTKFSTFATYRIKGSITDQMRDQAWEPRSVRARSRVVNQAQADLELKLGRRPTEGEVATHVDMTVQELRRVDRDVRSSRVASLSTPIGETDGGGMLEDMLMSNTDVTDLQPEVGEAAALMAAGLELLPEQDRILMVMIYIKGLALKEIAALLDVTESWVSLLHTRAMVTLQRTLAAAY
jgi:RNA polymerase sigma factor for flagellar operon FliA